MNNNPKSKKEEKSLNNAINKDELEKLIRRQGLILEYETHDKLLRFFEQRSNNCMTITKSNIIENAIGHYLVLEDTNKPIEIDFFSRSSIIINLLNTLMKKERPQAILPLIYQFNVKVTLAMVFCFVAKLMLKKMNSTLNVSKDQASLIGRGNLSVYAMTLQLWIG